MSKFIFIASTLIFIYGCNSHSIGNNSCNDTCYETMRESVKMGHRMATLGFSEEDALKSLEDIMK